MSGQELLDVILSVGAEITETKLHAIYEEWIERLKDVI
jgi:hypothetical protein